MNFVPSLNSLRFLGALFVILLHTGSYVWFESRGLERFHILISGSTGVVMFYVLSGFLLTSLAIEEIARTKAFSFKRFFARRAFRLFPLYFLALAFLAVLDFLGVTQISLTSWLYAVFYSYNFVPEAQYNGLLGSLHTLGTEEHFYLFFASIVALAVRLFRRQAIVIVGVVFATLFLMIDSLWQVFAKYDDEYFVGRWTWFAAKPILIGCLGAMAFSYGKQLGWFSQRKAVVKSLLVVGFLALYLKQIYGYSESLLSLGCLFLIIYFVLFPESFTSRLMGNKVFVYLGTISYGLYVWQSVFIGTGASHRWIDSPYLAVSLVFVTSIVSYELYEKQFLKIKQRFSSRIAA